MPAAQTQNNRYILLLYNTAIYVLGSRAVKQLCCVQAKMHRVYRQMTIYGDFNVQSTNLFKWSFFTYVIIYLFIHFFVLFFWIFPEYLTGTELDNNCDGGKQGNPSTLYK